MIFSGGLHEKVLDGSKTVTRRPVRYDWPGDQMQLRPCPYKVGKTYAVQPGRGKKALGRIRVTDAICIFLSEIDEAEARREGFENLHAFIEKWLSLYGAWCPPQLVWRIEFQLVEEPSDG